MGCDRGRQDHGKPENMNEDSSTSLCRVSDILECSQNLMVAKHRCGAEGVGRNTDGVLDQCYPVVRKH